MAENDAKKDGEDHSGDRIEKLRPAPLAARGRCHTWAASPTLSPTGARTTINKSSGMVREIMHINPPSTVNDFYDFRTILGKGGFGVVSEILHAKTFQAFAGKVQKKSTLKSPEDEDTFRKVMEILLNMPRPRDHIVTLLNIFEDDRNYYTVMQKCASTLACLVDPGLRMKEPDAPYTLKADRLQNFCKQILCGLSFLHRFRILHRDIKPENIMIENPYENKASDFDGKELVLQILDFDMCVMLPSDSEVLLTEFFSGTACFMAPEIFQETAYSAQSDIFALGGTMYFLVTERFPCPGISLSPELSTIDLHKMMCTWADKADASMEHDVEDSNAAWARLPADGIATLRKALAKDRECRWTSADKMQDSDWLRNVESLGKSGTDCPSPNSPAGGKPKRKRRQRLGTAPLLTDDGQIDSPQSPSPKYSYNDLLLQAE